MEYKRGQALFLQVLCGNIFKGDFNSKIADLGINNCLKKHKT